MAISTRSCFEQGGRELIELLTHCVFSFNTDVLFLYLVREYQFRPQAVGAIAIFDVFCGASAPARISATSTIPPRDMRIDHTISQLRAALQMATAPVAVSAPPVTAKQGDPKQGVSEQAAEGTAQPTKPSDGEPIRHPVANEGEEEPVARHVAFSLGQPSASG